ncbi:transposase [Thiorhodococcus minor]|uniref:Transposase DDE domain-containing protein n=1 Tax=Thiorhodococcus minor TaxID=57489 RepID=A0A6M0K5P8_9GAMM|nr:transposase [Thiorhodococcus minor]NEV64263.1 hypothetical protein [Thiorhodococcus minor]
MSQSAEQIETPEAFALCPPEASAGPRRAKPANGRGRRYKCGPARAQLTLLPPSVEDYVSADNPVRAISAFHYDAEHDGYHCPGGQRLNPVGKPATRNGTVRQRYRSKAKACADCALREQCLSAKGTRREIERSVHAEAVERHRAHTESEHTPGRRTSIRRHFVYASSAIA